MSLINKLLKDLDKRRHAKNAPTATRSGITRQLRAVETESVWVKVGRGSYLVFLFALTLAAGATIWYLNRLADEAWEEHREQVFQPVGDKIVRIDPPVQLAQTTPAVKQKVEKKPVTPVPVRKAIQKPAISPTMKSAKPQRKPDTIAKVSPAPVVTAKPPPMKVAVTPEVLEQQARKEAQTIYEEGLRLLDQGRVAEAEQSFAKALEVYPPHADARTTLGGLMMDSARWQQAGALFRTGLGIDEQSISFSLGLARTLVEQGNVPAALDVLEARDDGAVNHGEFLALLAALYQRQNEHRDAIEVYRRALVVQPYEGRWWMGLGISLEHRESWVQAQAAYENALKDRQLAGQLSAYVSQRLGRVRQHLPVTMANDL